jgi:hypothetical protein
VARIGRGSPVDGGYHPGMEPSDVAGPPDGGGDGRTGLDPAADGPTLDGDLGVLEQIEAELADVERALERLDDGTYSVCELCGRPIGEARLETLPATRVCADHGAPAAGEMTL